MTRITRSQKVLIAEDSTALTSQASSLDVTSSQPQALADLPKGHNTMPAVEEDNFNIDASLKSLKAAYRTAIGAGRKNKKGKNKKKDREETQSSETDQATETVTTLEEEKVVKQLDGTLARKELLVDEEILTAASDSNDADSPHLKDNENESSVPRTTQQQNTQPGQSTLTFVKEKLSNSRHDYILSILASRLWYHFLLCTVQIALNWWYYGLLLTHVGPQSMRTRYLIRLPQSNPR